MKPQELRHHRVLDELQLVLLQRRGEFPHFTLDRHPAFTLRLQKAMVVLRGDVALKRA